MALFTKEESLRYHEAPRPGKLEVLPSKRFVDQKDLSMAYSPGVANACRAIEEDPALAARYTGRSNLVAVVSNGTAVLGLGNIGPLAGKPVMEGKCVLFKSFADVDAYDIDLDCADPDRLIDIVRALEPTFGGINLEDIKAPECFYIETKLKELMNIPVFHDDQHGTAIITGAALLNGAEVAGLKLEDMKIVFSGAGAAGIACARYFVSLGVRIENIDMFDSKGHLHTGRDNLNEMRRPFARDTPKTLTEALHGANMLVGLSRKGTVTQDMVKGMAKSAIIFACANPDPEITYPEVMEVRPDIIMGTGRTDFPNQVNNVSCFPYMFRGALDVQARAISEGMKHAATRALAALAKEPVTDEVRAAYNGQDFSYGRDYIIPKPIDTRLVEWIAPAVAQAAMDEGLARAPIADMAAYKNGLRARVLASQKRNAMLVESYR